MNRKKKVSGILKNSIPLLLLAILALNLAWLFAEPADSLSRKDKTVVRNRWPRIVNYSPKAIQSAERNELFRFSIQAKDTSADTLSYSWSLNGLELSTKPSAEFTFGSIGKFTLTAVVTNGKAADSIRWAVVVADPKQRAADSANALMHRNSQSGAYDSRDKDEERDDKDTSWIDVRVMHDDWLQEFQQNNVPPAPKEQDN